MYFNAAMIYRKINKEIALLTMLVINMILPK